MTSGAAPSVTVIIVNYKSYTELDACLASIEGGERGTVEVIVVDNASSAEQLAFVARRYLHVRFIARPDNPGFGRAVNEAARQASGSYLLALNPDCVVRRDVIRLLADFLEAHPDVAVVGPRVYDPDGQVQRSARGLPGPLTALFGRTSLMTRWWPGNPISRRNLPADDRTRTPLDVDWVAGSCLMVRSDAFRRLGGFDERFFLYWEDADLCRRLVASGWRIVHVPSVAVIHQVGRSSRHASAQSIVAFHRSALLYYAKYSRGSLRYPMLALAAAGLGTRMALKLLLNFMRPTRQPEPAPPSRSASAGR